MSPYALPILGRLAWIDVILLVWFVLVAISVIFVALDAFTRLPEPGVIRWAWVLTTCYLGPVGAIVPYMQISGAAQDRQKAVSRGLPYVVDLMSLAMGAGLDFPGAGPQGITLAADGRVAFLSLSNEARVVAIELATRRVIGAVPAGDTPDGIAYSRVVVPR